MEDKLTEEDVYWFTILAYMEYLTSGITACFDMYQKNDAIVKASMDTGFRTVLCGSINNFVGTVEEMEQQFLKYNAIHWYLIGLDFMRNTRLAVKFWKGWRL